MCGDGCDGGYPIYAWRYFVHHGVVTEEVLIYSFCLDLIFLFYFAVRLFLGVLLGYATNFLTDLFNWFLLMAGVFKQ